MIPLGGWPSMQFGFLAILEVHAEQSNIKLTQSNLGYIFAVAAFVGVVYDWALTFGQEVELVWMQRWSLMTFLYLGVRYLGILFAALSMFFSLPTILVTDTVSLLYTCYYSPPINRGAL
ncbi:uncharacterized protein EDB93DRAFT_1256908 [Suillus bovinus]|uniref:uncharacterized protein n=1 Tax=Suillus bovinus TaxID=48563 RepID=UPI001B878E78|nr:uncharacterized protein EDB93DRAFT_1256908 [Suillus bovinus]KAG2127624.1 hypothetical protein EDB93DRAFT_1256908 [Suillus bovinus]